jgi:hypothetical protein
MGGYVVLPGLIALMQIRVICTPMGRVVSASHHAPFEHDRHPGQRPVRERQPGGDAAPGGRDDGRRCPGDRPAGAVE